MEEIYVFDSEIYIIKIFREGAVDSDNHRYIGSVCSSRPMLNEPVIHQTVAYSSMSMALESVLLYCQRQLSECLAVINTLDVSKVVLELHKKYGRQKP
jgi:hypothetical protein